MLLDEKVEESQLGAFLMLPEGQARFFVPGTFVDGPWSEHYEPAESPVPNPLHPLQSPVSSRVASSRS